MTLDVQRFAGCGTAVRRPATGIKIAGHRTRMIFDDYDEANATDVTDAAKLL
jgi:hypothetical protein